MISVGHRRKEFLTWQKRRLIDSETTQIGVLRHSPHRQKRILCIINRFYRFGAFLASFCWLRFHIFQSPNSSFFWPAPLI
jgi:hypothetical protein